MNDLELQSVRDFILCAVARFPRGATQFTIEVSVASAGFELEKTGPDSLAKQLDYLTGRKLLETPAKAHTPSLTMFKLTSDGDDYLRTRKLL
jgi:hypothetical protein